MLRFRPVIFFKTMSLQFACFRLFLIALFAVGLIPPVEAQRAVDYLKGPINKARENVEKHNSKRDLDKIVDPGDKPSAAEPKQNASADEVGRAAPDVQSPDAKEKIEVGLSEEATEEEAPLQPSDASSLRLMENLATVIGAKAMPGIRNVSARGTFSYGRYTKEFEVVETSDGERCLTLYWRYLGRHYREQNKSIPPSVWGANDGQLSREIHKKVVAANGDESWERVFGEVLQGGQLLHRYQFGKTVVSHGRTLEAKPLLEEDRAVLAGGYAEVSPGHFQNVYLFLQPILGKSERPMGYAYIGQEKLLGRSMYVVRHQSKRLFYFDAEKFLLVQWGGLSRLGGQVIHVDYRSTAFKRWSSLLFPSRIELVVAGELLGSYAVEAIEVNKNLAAGFFDLPGI